MIYCPEKYQKKKYKDLNSEFLKLNGILEDKEAKKTLAQFLRHNLGISMYLLTGMQLEPYQEITLRAFFNKNFSMCVWGRGSGKTHIASAFSVLYPIFEPNTKILIAGPTFRTSRFIFENIEKLVGGREGKLLAQCFIDDSKHKVRRNDLFSWNLDNGSSIKAIPLNGEKIRGFRANVLILDEFLLLPEELVKTVLMPFLIAPQDAAERIKIRKIEDALIKQGLMEENDRKNFSSNVKMIVLSSASFTFDYLYKLYRKWEDEILDEREKLGIEQQKEDPEKNVRDAQYFISQLSYEAIPEHLVDKNIIEEQKGDSSDAIFNREYRAMFTDGSASYFSAEKMKNNTLHVGESPHVQLVGDKNKRYILSIDPSFSKSPTADFFAMSIFQLNEDNQSSYLVHSYARAGADLKDNIFYFYYLLNAFNIVMIISDHADGNFIDAANESALFKDNNIMLDFFDFDSSIEDTKSYQDELKKAKLSYNLESKKICFRQAFGQDNFIRRANELLQSYIDRRKILFASPINGNDNAFSKASAAETFLEYSGESNIIDLIDNVDNNIHGTKAECALIEVKTNSQGHQSFDLPLNLKKSKSPNRPRRDRYTALLLGNWAVKCFYEINAYVGEKKEYEPFTPFLIR